MSSKLAMSIAQQIVDDYQGSNRLPTQNSLVQQYFVSRTTIVKALDILKKDNIIYSVQGGGIYFSNNKLPLYLEGVYSYDFQLKKIGVKVKNELLSFKIIKPPKEIMNKMSLDEDEFVYEILRQKINPSTGEVLIIQNNYLRESRFKNLDGNTLNNKRLYAELYEKFNLDITSAHEDIYIKHPPKKILKYIDNYIVKCLVINRITYEEDLIIEFTKSYILTDKLKYSINLNLCGPIY